MRARLKEVINISEQQKAHFRSTIEDLREQLQNAVSGRESLLNRRYANTYMYMYMIVCLCMSYSHKMSMRACVEVAAPKY